MSTLNIPFLWFLLCFWSMLHVTLENLSESWEVLVSQSILVHGGSWTFCQLLTICADIIIKGHMSVLLPFRWFYNIVGDSRCPISDTWWQTETGGFMVWSLQFTPLVKFDIFFLGHKTMFYELLSLISLDHPFAWRLASETRFCNLSFLWCSGNPIYLWYLKRYMIHLFFKFWTAVCLFYSQSLLMRKGKRLKGNAVDIFA